MTRPLGWGAFWDAASGNPNVAFTGSEIDPSIIKFWNKASQDSQAVIDEEDYLLSWGKSYRNIVCNPPYLRFQKFLNRKPVFEQFEQHLNLRLPGYINTASAFLVKSLSELEAGGRLAYVMPLEFLNTGYGRTVKERLVENGHLAAIISLDCEKDVFPDATTTVGVVLYDSARKFSHVRFYIAKSINGLESILDGEPMATVPCEELNPGDKWLQNFESNSFAIEHSLAVPLDTYGRFSRGIATGANEFFVLKPSTVRRWGLQESETSPIVARSSQIRAPYFDDEDHRALMERDDPSLLFCVNGAMSEQATGYIELGELKGYDKRFLTRNRDPWYKTESRYPSPILLGVFSRGGYKVIRNYSQALNLTCFHGFQPSRLGQQYIDHLFLYLASATGREIVSLSLRKYGDSLDKIRAERFKQRLGSRAGGIR